MSPNGIKNQSQNSHNSNNVVDKDTVIKLSSKVLRTSKGQKVGNGDRLWVSYQGTLLSGEEFDANFDFSSFELIAGKTAFDFTLGKGQVIQGWDKGLLNKKIGSVVELTIPADQAYGEAGVGERIPPNSPLQFKVEILAALPAGTSQAVYTNYSDLRIKRRKIGLTDELRQSTARSKIGLDGADELQGDTENDLLIGLKGNDRITGKRGADVLIGGSGKNTYIYENVKDSRASKGKTDHILDFGRKDKIDLSAVAKELQFIGDDRFTGTPGDVRFKKGTLELDKNGDRTADLALQLPGTNTKSITASNLIL